MGEHMNSQDPKQQKPQNRK